MTVSDQLDRQMRLPDPPQRIVSLVPSQTELLYDLGLRDEVVGITRFCVHPSEWHRGGRPHVGGTKDVDVEAVLDLEPDAVIAAREENTREVVEELEEHVPVWVSDVTDLLSALDMVREVGVVVGRGGQANALANRIAEGFESVRAMRDRVTRTERVAYLIWRRPWMAAGSDTFIDAMLTECGWTNVFAGAEGRYPSFTEQELADRAPSRILLSSEPYPFKERHIESVRALVPQARVEVVDGELFSWYGSRLEKSPPYLKRLMSG